MADKKTPEPAPKIAPIAPAIPLPGPSQITPVKIPRGSLPAIKLHPSR
jgi:hypothetical protein